MAISAVEALIFVALKEASACIAEKPSTFAAKIDLLVLTQMGVAQKP